VERQIQTTADGVAWTMNTTAPDAQTSESESRGMPVPIVRRGLDDRWIGAA
jgi:hypothetical protein